MRVLAFVVPLALLASPFVLLAGCGGHHHNGQDHECTAIIHADSAYAGSYVVTYTPSGRTSDTSLTFNLTVDAKGFITGSGSDPSGDALTLASDAEGKPSFAGDDTMCQNLAYLKIDYARPGVTDVLEVRVSKKLNGTLIGTYTGADSDGGTPRSQGTLTVVAAATQ